MGVRRARGFDKYGRHRDRGDRESEKSVGRADGEGASLVPQRHQPDVCHPRGPRYKLARKRV